MHIENPLVSVVVPVYNGQKTIERCVDSILNQTFRDFELIIINDGSTDNTENILRRYIKSDERLILITQENKGVSAARNAGMNQAIGKWITFVDADDYLEENCFEAVLSSGDINKYDLVFWNYYRVKPFGREAPIVFQQPKGKYSVKELLPYVFDNKGRQGLSSVYCRLFQRELILKNKLLFQEEVVSSEDRIFMIDYLTHSEQCLGVEKFLYNRTLNIDSVMHRWHKDAKEEYLLSAKLLKERLLRYGIWNICQKSFYIWILQDSITLYLETYICHPQNTDDKKKRKKELYAFIDEEIISEALKQIKFHDLPTKSKVKFITVKHKWIGILDRWYRNKKYFI